MNFQWNTLKISEILGLGHLGASQKILEITTDSRSAKPGSVFIAIKGDSLDGHSFIPQAISQGATAIISEHPGTNPNGSFFQVPSTLDAIRKLAHTYRKAFSIPMIAVVGAVGKTTTKELLGSLLQGKYTHVMKTEGSQNGFLGIPITLLQLKPETEIAIIEIGIDEIGAMDQHLALVEPTHAILTKNGPEHLHQLKTVEIAAEEELKAYDYSLQHQIPIALNLSDVFVSQWVKRHSSKISKTISKSYSLSSTDQPEYLGTYSSQKHELSVKGPGIEATFQCPLPGEHHAHNLLAAITLSQFFKLSVDEIMTGLQTFKTAYGRTEVYQLPRQIRVIGDYYNSNPTSLDAALKLLTSEKGAPAYHAALGDMLELGENEEQFHRSMAQSIMKLGVTHVWLYGPRMKWLDSELRMKGFQNSAHFESHDELTQSMRSSLQPGAQVLIKGSRGMKMEKVLKALLHEGEQN